jgi:uncharacterized phiE125 gp8 family phage protein
VSIRATSVGAPGISLSDAKEHLRVDHSDDDILIAGIVDTACEHFSALLDRTIGTRTWLWTLEEDCERSARYLALPYPPVTAIVAVRYLDETSTLVPYDASLYETIEYANDPRTWLRFTEPASGRDVVNVEYRAGDVYVPAPIQHAVKMLVTRLYENRGEPIDSKFVEDRAIMSLLSPYRPMVV